MIDDLPSNRELLESPRPWYVSGTASESTTGDKTLDISLPQEPRKGSIFQLKGLNIVAGSNQLIGETQIIDTGGNIKGKLRTTRTVRGSSVNWSKERILRNKYISVTLFRDANANGGPFNMINDLEFPFGVTLKRAYATLVTSPGAADTATFRLVTGGVTTTLVAITNATEGENEGFNLNIPGDQDVDITIDDSAAAGNGYQIVLWFLINDMQTDFPPDEYFPIVLFRDDNANGGPFNMMNDLEVPENCVIKRAYCTLVTAPGAVNVTFAVNGTQILQINNVISGENEALNIPLQKDTDLDITVNDAGAAGNGYQLVLWCQRTDPISENDVPSDIEDQYGQVYVFNNEKIRVNYNQGTISQTITVELTLRRADVK